jgi:hypothetical protein
MAMNESIVYCSSSKNDYADKKIRDLVEWKN